MKKIYFACSIRGGRDDVATYATLVDYIKGQAVVLTEIFADGKLTAQGMDKPNTQIWTTDMAWVREADAIIAEVTNASLGVGYEIAKAEEWGKPILALFNERGDGKRLSAMIEGSPNTKTVYYKNLTDAKSAIDTFIQEVHQHKRLN